MSTDRDPVDDRRILRISAVIMAIYGLVGFPLGILIVANGAAAIAFGVYVAAAVLTAGGVTLWLLGGIVGGEQEVEICVD